ncbi:MAG: ABC transporter ATP-binding protein [Candidatus Thermoplasmatota archaeon]|nr:ABC transporter ATP-binding protein [Candidatus Thermoplasmatota archaeon]MCL5962795.1 ABC transporter ATP-binding protein [Candidatus Thermoplasmatota archaeon]
MSEYTIKMDDVSKVYEKKYALKNVNLEFKSGRIYGILGTNGAGKSTLLKLIYGITSITTGRIYLNEKLINKERNVMKKMAGYLPELPLLNDYLTVDETITGTLRLRGYTYEKSGEVTDLFLKWINLGNFRDELIVNCSKGIKQKVAFGIATLHNPAIFLLDEPFMGLDPPTTFLIKKWLVDMKSNSKIIIITTHIASVVEEIADTIIILNNGKVIKTGTLSDLLSMKIARNLEEVLFNMNTDY